MSGESLEVGFLGQRVQVCTLVHNFVTIRALAELWDQCIATPRKGAPGPVNTHFCSSLPAPGNQASTFCLRGSASPGALPGVRRRLASSTWHAALQATVLGGGQTSSPWRPLEVAFSECWAERSREAAHLGPAGDEMGGSPSVPGQCPHSWLGPSALGPRREGR